MRRPQHRLRRLEQQLGELSLDCQAVEQAFFDFGATGELPADDRLARAVVTWANTGINEANYGPDTDSQAALLRDHLHSLRQDQDAIMNALRKEAVHADELLRSVARDILRGLADLGADVTTQLFRDRGVTELQDQWCSSTALSLLGFPWCLAVPPHEERAYGLFARIEALRERIDDDDPGWEDAFLDATGAFRANGTVPANELLRDALLVDAEVAGLVLHWAGRGDPELMQAVAASDVEPGDAREAALVRVQQLVANGRPQRRNCT